jgi:hypothetical protein
MRRREGHQPVDHWPARFHHLADYLAGKFVRLLDDELTDNSVASRVTAQHGIQADPPILAAR